MTRSFGRFALLATVALACAPLRAQQPREAEVLAVVNSLFQGMRTKDTAILRRAFAPGAQLTSVGARGGTPSVRSSSADAFIAAVARPSEAWIERIVKPQVQIDGNLAAVWGWYDFHLGDVFSHCGVDAFHLARTADGWKIVHVSDTERTDDCKEP
jgi:Putative lumazine-binding